VALSARRGGPSSVNLHCPFFFIPHCGDADLEESKGNELTERKRKIKVSLKIENCNPKLMIIMSNSCSAALLTLLWRAPLELEAVLWMRSSP
jgi:hypothetical protein